MARIEEQTLSLKFTLKCWLARNLLHLVRRAYRPLGYVVILRQEDFREFNNRMFDERRKGK